MTIFHGNLAGLRTPGARVVKSVDRNRTPSSAIDPVEIVSAGAGASPAMNADQGDYLGPTGRLHRAE